MRLGAMLALPYTYSGVVCTGKTFPSSSSLPSSSACQTELSTMPIRAQQLMIDTFLQNNQLEHMHQVMNYHPEYLEAFFNAQTSLMRDDIGPLTYQYRHYIAIMAAARHQCVYLMRLYSREFLLSDGDRNWLRGLDHVPQKLRNLAEINRILAHRPWLLKKEHIEKLLRGANNWSLSELMQALIIMIHFHTLSSFVYGCGINPDMEHVGPQLGSSSGEEETDYSSDSSGETNSNLIGEPNLQQLMQKMEQLREEENSQEDGPTQEELLQRFQSVESQSVEISVPMKERSSRRSEAQLFVTDIDFAYSDFASRPHDDIQTFRVQDYSWKDHGYPLVNRLYNDIGDLLDKKFDIAFNLTYNTMGDNDQVDTTAFRQAIWYYIHCMYGIRHDDYDYAQVNQMLERGLKTYVKTVTCYPERVSRRDSDGVMKAFKHSEKVHVNFMIMEARMQAELLYALRAVNHYMT
ncbi:sestrin-3-like isoform X2 [Babylonia areolata]|uniref:sestrin-3-like isoform X2 n=1 Tax=Babylonia areolata TaxID=304850 RepID=UPI003FD502DD